MENITRPTILEVDIQAFINNITKIQNYIGNSVKIMPIIKANGYGTYINTKLEVLNYFEIVGVATADEGAFIRRLGYKKDIFILNQPYTDEIPKIIENDLTVGVCSDDFIRELEKTKKEVKVHLELETGMERTGISPSQALDFLDNLGSNIKVEGAYTHLSSADSDYEYTKNQLEMFNEIISKIKNKISLKYIHSHASNGILNYLNVGDYNLVRPGIIMYGYPSNIDTYKKIDLEPVAKLKSKITFLKTVKEGISIGYGRSFITEKETKVATIPVGYADGLRRELSNKGNVVINGKKARIIGKICMDSIMVDVTDFNNINIGDDVYIWDNEQITLEEVAKQCNTINYEILSCISNRVPRKFGGNYGK